MDIHSEQAGPRQAVLRPVGRLDAETSPHLREAIHDLAARLMQEVVIDLGQVEFMDSSGLSALVSGMKALRKNGGKLAICRPNGQIKTALRLTMLDRVFPDHPDEQAAFQYLNEQADN